MTRALVTGAGKRLGHAMALYLAAARAMTLRCIMRGPHLMAADERRLSQLICAMGRQRLSRLQADLLDEDATACIAAKACRRCSWVGTITCFD